MNESREGCCNLNRGNAIVIDQEGVREESLN